MCMINTSVLYFSIKRKWEKACLCHNGQLCIAAMTTDVALRNLFAFTISSYFLPSIFEGVGSGAHLSLSVGF